MSSIIHSTFKALDRLFKIIPGGYKVSHSRVVVAAYRFLAHKMRRRQVKVFGNTMYLDAEDHLDLSIKGIHEPLTTRFFQKEIKRGNTVLDIGAHIGYYTLMAAKLVGEKGRVFSFEPNPSNYEICNKNIRTNGYNNVTLIQKAVSDIRGKTKLYFESNHNTRWSSIYDIHEEGKSFEVDVTTIDKEIKQYNGAVNFIKMDIEGAELAALKGMTNILEKNPKLKIVGEFRPALLQRAGITPREFLRFFTENGFQMFYADEAHGQIIPAGEDEIIDFCDKYFAANIFCVR